MRFGLSRSRSNEPQQSPVCKLCHHCCSVDDKLLCPQPPAGNRPRLRTPALTSGAAEALLVVLSLRWFAGVRRRRRSTPCPHQAQPQRGLAADRRRSTFAAGSSLACSRACHAVITPARTSRTIGRRGPTPTGWELPSTRPSCFPTMRSAPASTRSGTLSLGFSSTSSSAWPTVSRANARCTREEGRARVWFFRGKRASPPCGRAVARPAGPASPCGRKTAAHAARQRAFRSGAV